MASGIKNADIKPLTIRTMLEAIAVIPPIVINLDAIPSIPKGVSVRCAGCADPFDMCPAVAEGIVGMETLMQTGVMS